MAYIYNKDDITLKIDNLRKKEHFFYEDGNNEPVGKINILKKDLIIKLTSFKKDDEELYEKLASCYNQFINNNPKLKNYGVILGQVYSDSMKDWIEKFPFDVYQIKKNLDTPLNLVTKKQIDELGRNGVSYYSVYNDYTLNGIEKNKNFLFKMNNSFLPKTGDFFKDSVLNVYFDKLGGIPVEIKNSTLIFKISKFLGDSKIDKNEEIWMPKINCLKKESTGNLIELDDKEKAKSIDITSIELDNPINLSNIDQKEIYLRLKNPKENLLKTLETIKDKENKTVIIRKEHINELGLPHKIQGIYSSAEYKCDELIDAIKKQSNELSLDK